MYKRVVRLEAFMCRTEMRNLVQNESTREKASGCGYENVLLQLCILTKRDTVRKETIEEPYNKEIQKV